MKSAATVTSLTKPTGALLTTRAGAQARVEVRDGDEVLVVSDAAGRVLYEYTEATRRAVVHAPEGDLTFRAADGDLDLQASRAVNLRAGDTLDLSAGRTIKLTGAEGAEGGAASVQLDGRGVEVKAPRVETVATRADVTVGTARLVARSVETVADTIKRVAHVVETHAGRIVERAQNVYQDIDVLAQTRAGKIRLVADTAMNLFARRAFVKADQQVKLKGEKIHLA